MTLSAALARRKVTGFVVDEISTNMHGMEPTMVGSRWRVPICLSLPPTGDLGEVGVIAVDVESGELDVSPTLIQEIIRRAMELTSSRL